MIVSRGAELGTLDALIGGLRGGDGCSLLLRGDPGIGKTTLLDALARRGEEDVLVLRAGGVETEAELGFAALADLLAPVLDHLAALPEPQSAALAAALALGPPAPGDRLAVCVATLGLLRAAARERPVLAIVDDMHWLDAASRECVLYLARRAGGPLAVALAVREPVDHALEHARLPELRLGPLQDDASLELLRRVAPDLAPPVAAALAEAAAGNPLALVELPATLTADQRSGVTPIELPVAPGGRLREAFAGRIGDLGEPARRALLVAATHAGHDLTTVAAACTAAGTDVADLSEAEARGMVRIEAGRVTFAHPILRGAAYHAAAATDRRGAHRALAGVLDGERRAWHLASAAAGPDEAVAAELERVAGGAAARRAFAAASAAYERAARLSPEGDDVARRLLAAGQAASAAAARDRALALLEEAAGAAGESQLRVRAEHLRGRMLVWSGSPVEATRRLVAEAGRAADPALGAAILADAANACTVTNAYHRAEELARGAVARLEAGAGEGADPLARAPALAMLGWALVLRGKPDEARPVLEEAGRLAEGIDPLGAHWPWQHLLLLARIPLGELEDALAIAVDRCDRAREAGALAALGGTLIVTADVALRLGDWERAEDAAREAIRVAGDTGQRSWHGYALTLLTRAAGARGHAREGREAAQASMEIVEAEDIRSGRRFVLAALGFLELSLDRPYEAIVQLEAVERIVTGSGLEDPTLVPWAPDLVEAHARAGSADAARRVLAVLERQAAATGTAYSGAAAARGRGMLDDDFDAAFAEALAHDDRRPMPFERARTLLAYGRRLHRARRRADARDRLREALSGFERLGAAAWAAQAENELRAAGARRRASRGSMLTPQELRVAAAVRRGSTNREIAAELFLAPKTIEFHLRQIYRKLGIRSRAQLVATLSSRRDQH